MLLQAASLLLLGALHTALGQATPEGKLVFKELTSEQVTFTYDVPHAGCQPNVRTWVGVWKADTPIRSEYKAWQYFEGSQGEIIFRRAEVGAGEWQAALLCEDGRRAPFARSCNFEFPCIYKWPRDYELDDNGKSTPVDTKSTEKSTASCKSVSNMCYDCQMLFPDGCGPCEQCEEQCGGA